MSNLLPFGWRVLKDMDPASREALRRACLVDGAPATRLAARLGCTSHQVVAMRGRLRRLGVLKDAESERVSKPPRDNQTLNLFEGK